MAISPLPIPPSRADAANFSDRADAFMAQLPTFANEANSLQADVNSKQATASSAASTATTKASEASISATNASNSASSASTSATNASASATAAQNWAIKTDGPVTGSEYSAKYWGQIAQGFVVGSLIDDNATSTVKVWSGSKVNNFAAKKDGGNTFVNGQNIFTYAGGNSALASAYSIKSKSYLIEDINNYIGLYSSSGTLNLGFGDNATSIISKYTFTSSGDFTAIGRVTSAGVTTSGSVDILGDPLSSCNLAVSGYNSVQLFSNTAAYGIYSSTGGYLLRYDRASAKSYFAGIDSADMWHNGNVLFVPGTFGNTQGRVRYPNGHIRQWGWVNVPANSVVAVNFGLAFPNACTGATISIFNSVAASYTGFASVAAVGQQGLSINNRYNAQFNFYWEAHGN